MPTTPDQLTRRRVAASVALLTVMTAWLGACSLFEDDPNAPQPTLPPPPETDVPYGSVAGCEGTDVGCGGSQQVDIYRSDRPGPNPVLVYFHGGGFILGDKEGSISESLDAALDDGWDIVSANYRLATPEGANRFPAAVQDARSVVRWVKAVAGDQDWDPAQVAVMGQSAGGNLAGLVAVTADQPEFDAPAMPPELAAQDPSVIAAVALNPVSDLNLLAATPAGLDMTTQYTGCTPTECPGVYAQGSVQTHVDGSAAPMLALHGAQDPLAGPEQGVLVRDAYDSAGIGDRFELVVVDDGPQRYQGHDVDWKRFINRFMRFLNDQRS